MPVTFHSPSYGNVVMLERDARYVIGLMGHSDNVPGAIDAEGVPAALERLKQELARLEASHEPDEHRAVDDDEEDEEVVGWRRRAWPLLQMLAAAADNEAHIRWD